MRRGECEKKYACFACGVYCDDGGSSEIFAKRDGVVSSAMSLDNPSLAEVLSENGFVCSKTTGTSMFPFIKSGRDTVVILKKTARLKKNDVALFVRKDGKIILHRVMGVEDGLYYIVGDNCLSGERVPENAVLGAADGWFKDKKYLSCSRRGYVFRSKLWSALFPVRGFLLFFMRLPYRVCGKIKRMLRKNQ